MTTTPRTNSGPATQSIVCVIGTRPEAVKMAPVIHALRDAEQVEVRVVNTGQHRELLAETLALLGLHCDVSLDLMVPSQRLAGYFGRCVEALDATLLPLKPDAVIAQGDTSTVLATALVAFYQQLPFFHVEAGLRTGILDNPFPEEMHRSLATRLACMHFAPTNAARDNLLHEGVPEARILVTGNTVIDSLLLIRARKLPHGIALTPGRRLILVTAHRRENFGERLRAMLQALKEISRRHPDVEIVYPAHLNPEVRRAIADEIGPADRIRIVEPMAYGAFVTLMDAAHLILTDSGGIQEEAPVLGKPVLVMRDQTERPEAINAGVARLVGADTQAIVAETSRLLDDGNHYRAMAQGSSPYGDGQAGTRIADAVLAQLRSPTTVRCKS